MASSGSSVRAVSICVGRVAHGGAELAHLRGSPDGRELDAGCARLEQPVDRSAIELRDPHERRQPEGVRVADEHARRILAELRVLEIDDREVVPGGRDEVDHLRRGKLHEEPPSPVAKSQHV
jgi:hypothetical protein